MGDSVLRFKGNFRKHRLSAGLVVTNLVAAAVIAVAPELGDDIAPPLVLANSATAGYLFLRKSSSFDRRERQAWELVGSGFLLAALGVLVVGLIQMIQGQAPAFGATDLLFLTTYVMIMAGLIRLPHVRNDLTHRLRIVVDAVVGALSMATILWVLFLAGVWANLNDVSAVERAVGALYPLADMTFLVVLLIVFLRRSTYRFDRRMLVIGAAFLVQAVADITYVVSGAGRTFAEAQPLFPLFLIAGAGYISAGIILEWKPALREYAERDLSWLPEIAPYGLATMMAVMLISQIESSGLGVGGRPLFYSTMVVGALVMARQGIAIRENHVHVERERRALISSISHELRTPLTAMVGFLDVLTDDRYTLPDDERGELLMVVDQQAAYMSRIVSDMVLLARGRPDRLELSIRDIRCLDLVNRSASVAEGGSEGLTVVCESEIGASVDPDRLQQVLVNLLSNAKRYGGDRRMVVVKRSGADLSIAVHDDGKGVPKRHEIMIWERFERGTHHLDANIPGSGIGLAIVDTIAIAHGGSAYYRRSEELGGACFAVELPGRAFDMPVSSLVESEDAAGVT